MPAVSVQIASYNLRDLIGDAIESVLNQTYRDFELTVIDDGSTDDSYEFIKENYGDRLTLLRQENHGIAYTQNVGIRRAKGRFIAFLDADDLWEPTYLEKMVGLLESSPKTVGMVYCAATVDNGPGEPSWTHSPKFRGNCLYEHLTSQLMVSMSRVVVRREVFDRVGLLDLSFKRSLDTDLWTRIAQHYDADVIEEPLVIKRFYGTNTMCNPDHFLEGTRILDKVFKDPDCPAHVLKWRRRSYANRYQNSLSAFAKIDHLPGTIRSFLGIIRWRPESLRSAHLKKTARVLWRNMRRIDSDAS